MANRVRKPLRIIDAPRVGPILDAPPALAFSNHTVDYTCGHCGTVLMHAEDGQVHELMIRCNRCSRYNVAEG